MNLRLLSCLGLLFLTLAACSDADSLGDEPPVTFTITGAPTWANGIGTLTETKCGYCHAVPRPEIAPSNTPTDLDLNRYTTQVINGEVVRGGDSIGRWLFDGILDHPVTQYADTTKPRQMPLDYGTPVTDQEKTYYLAWSNAGSPQGNEVQPDTGDLDLGAQLYFTACVSCHDIGNGVPLPSGEFLGPALRPESITVAKVKSMWLDKWSTEPLSDEEAASIRLFALSLLAP
jgi:mono/diheme cytochrome c family protein